MWELFTEWKNLLYLLSYTPSLRHHYYIFLLLCHQYTLVFYYISNHQKIFTWMIQRKAFKTEIRIWLSRQVTDSNTFAERKPLVSWRGKLSPSCDVMEFTFCSIHSKVLLKGKVLICCFQTWQDCICYCSVLLYLLGFFCLSFGLVWAFFQRGELKPISHTWLPIRSGNLSFSCFHIPFEGTGQHFQTLKHASTSLKRSKTKWALPAHLKLKHTTERNILESWVWFLNL